MKKFTFAFYGEPKFDNPENGNRYMEKWKAWERGLSEVLPVTPLARSKIVSPGAILDEGGPNRLTGFSIVKADSLDAAVKIAMACPHLEHGTIHVGEVMEMK